MNLDLQSTADLVGQALRGESAAFSALVEKHLRPAYSVALAILGRTADAEDVAQDALLTAFEKLHSCRNPAKFRPWLLQIVRNQARNAVARRRLRDVTDQDQPPELAASDPKPEDALLRDRLLDALATLPESRREVVLLHDLEGWTHPEIAEALGCSEVMSRQLLFQARRSLRLRLAEHSPQEGQP